MNAQHRAIAEPLALRRLGVRVLAGVVAASTVAPARADVADPLPFGEAALALPERPIVSGVDARTVRLLAEALATEPRPRRRVELLRDLAATGRADAAAAIAGAATDPVASVRAQAARSAGTLAAALAEDGLAEDGLADALKPEASTPDPSSRGAGAAGGLAGAVRALVGDADPDVRAAAVRSAPAVGEAAVVESALRDADPAVRRAALASAYTPGHTAAVAATLGDLPAADRVVALASVARIGEADRVDAASVGPAVAALLDGSMAERAGAARALGAVGATGQADAVLARLGDPSSVVRSAAAGALAGVVADPSRRLGVAVGVLADADASARAAAADVIAQTADGAASGGSGSDVSPSAWAATVGPLAGLLGDADPSARASARDALAAVGAASPESLAAVAGAMVPRLDDASPLVREAASYVLGALRSDAGLDRHAALLSGDSLDAAAQAAASLGRIAPASAGDADDAAVGDGLAALVGRSVETIGEVGDRAKASGGTPSPADAARVRSAARAGREALLALSAVGRGGDALRLARPMIPRDSLPTDLRAAAIYVAGLHGDPGGGVPGPAILSVLADPEAPEALQLESAKALGHLRHAPAAGPLASLASGGSPAMAYVAHDALGRINGTSTPFAPPPRVRRADVSVAAMGGE